MSARITIGELTGLHPRHAAFVVEYLKDFDAGMAAERAGYSRGTGQSLLTTQEIADALSKVVEERLQNVCIDAEWVLLELVDNHILARQQGKLTASNTALRTIAQHASVDAFAAEKVQIAGDDEIRARLLRGRKHRRGDDEPEEVEDPGKEVTFF